MDTKEETEIISNISAESAFRYLKNLCKFGDRFVGSASDREAIDYVKSEFKKTGLNVICSEIEVPSVTLKEPATLEVTKPVTRRVEACTVLFSPPTPPEGITAEMIYVGDGDEKDYNGKDVEGKIVLVNGTPSLFLEGRILRAAKHKAVGFIEIHINPYSGWSSFEVYDLEKRFLKELIPSVSISCVEGFDLIRMASSGRVEVNLKVNTEVLDQTKTCFVRGILRGEEKSDEKIAVIAHRDTGYTQGANDDASGEAIMLEVARVLSKCKPKRTIEFVSSTLEETGSSVGMAKFLLTYKEFLEGLRAVVNIEQPTVGGDLFLTERGDHHVYGRVVHSEWMIKLLEEVAKQLGYSLHHKEKAMPQGMHWVGEEGRFLQIGIPAVILTKYGPEDPYYHTPLDTPEKIDPNMLKVGADIVGVGVWRMANADELPTPPEITSDAFKKLEKGLYPSKE